jgi:transposase
MTQENVKKLQIDYWNIKRMYDMQKETNKNLKDKVKILQQENTNLKQELEIFTAKIEKIELEKEELKRMIFKWKSKVWETLSIEKPKKKSRERSKDSYNKSAPKDEDVTKRIHDVIENCPTCGTLLTRKRHLTKYIENVVLPSDGNIPIREIEKHIVDKGYCKSCKRRHLWRTFHGQRVSLGEEVKILVWYLTVIMRLSYHQTAAVLLDICGISISDWEISYIQKDHASRMRRYYEDLKHSISQQKWVHMDETTWKVQKEWEWWYWWIMRWTETSDMIYMLWKSRWKGNAEQLVENIGEDSVGISDDYWVYKNLFKYHQLCRAHPYRKLRDLSTSWVLDNLKIQICMTIYKGFWELYEEAKVINSEEFDPEKRRIQKEIMRKKFDYLALENNNDPQKLANIKKSLRKNREHYFTFMDHKWIPLDNNSAERWLRHMVLKRKTSFWSKTQKWADAMAVLSSILMSLRHTDQKTFFTEYKKLLTE